MYFVDKCVGFSDIGPDYKIKLTKILDYFQDTCISQSEGTPFGAEGLRNRGFAWVLSSWQVIINRYPKINEKVRVGTAPYSFKGFMGERNFVLLGEDEELLAVANSIWSFIDVEKLTLTRIPADVQDSYNLEEKIEMDYAPRKVLVPADMEPRGNFPVLYHNLDSNNHVNNAQYIAMAEDLIPEGRRCRQMRAEYRSSAIATSTIYAYTSFDQENNTHLVSLANEEKQPYVCIEFSY